MEGLDVAVIGMSCRFPGAKSPETYWDNLLEGKESITYFNDYDLSRIGNSDTLETPLYVKAKGILEDVRTFDYNFFRLSHEEAEIADPQLLSLLEASWTALEDSGYNFEKNSLSTGVFIATSSSFYWRCKVINEKKYTPLEKYKLAYLTEEHYYSTQISYKMNLTGPSYTVSTACSSSLIAIHLACRALLMGECDIALVGGTSISFPFNSGYYYNKEMIYSPDGHCRAFDEDSNGTVPGDGTGVVVLKMLDKAIVDRDNIYAVIKSSAVNNDGNMKAGYTSPSIGGQASVIQTAYELADINPENISFIEAHGTGTKFGDAIELEALKRAFDTSKKDFCAVGSVKPNIGYLGAASGIASFIKAVLSIKNRKYPPTINYKYPNSRMNLPHSPFYINTDVIEFREDKGPIIAGVSSYGDGGTNAHIVLSEAPRMIKTNEDEQLYIVTFSANSKFSLEGNIGQIKQYLKDNDDVSFQDIVYTLNIGRKDFDYRCYTVCSGKNDLLARIENCELCFKDLHSNANKSSNSFQNQSINIDEEGFIVLQKDTTLSDRREYLKYIGDLWLDGYKIDWKKFYMDKSYNKISIPTYVFDKKILHS